MVSIFDFDAVASVAPAFGWIFAPIGPMQQPHQQETLMN
jgi:hypothetical protein